MIAILTVKSLQQYKLQIKDNTIVLIIQLFVYTLIYSYYDHHT